MVMIIANMFGVLKKTRDKSCKIDTLENTRVLILLLILVSNMFMAHQKSTLF